MEAAVGEPPDQLTGRGCSDRRSSGRQQTADQHGIVCARVRPGHEVTVLDLSSGGALIEAGHRLLPGTRIELQLGGADYRLAVRGRVLRCAVSSLHPARITYRGAVAFDREFLLRVHPQAPGAAGGRSGNRPGDAGSGGGGCEAAMRSPQPWSVQVT